MFNRNIWSVVQYTLDLFLSKIENKTITKKLWNFRYAKIILFDILIIYEKFYLCIPVRVVPKVRNAMTITVCICKSCPQSNQSGLQKATGTVTSKYIGNRYLAKWGVSGTLTSSLWSLNFYLFYNCIFA